MAEPAPAGGAAAERRYLAFRVDAALYAVPAEAVAEVIRAPAVARAPLAPRALLGLSNLRGAVIAVAGARELLGRSEGPSERAVVLDGPERIALAVDTVEGLIGSEGGPGGGPARGARLLDVWPMLRDALGQGPQRARTAAVAPVPASAPPRAAEAIAARERLVVFEAGGQSFALPVGDVEEIIRTPAATIAAPGAEAVLIGLAAHRGRLLPLLSLPALVGAAGATGAADGALGQALVVRVRGARAGLAVERVRTVLDVDPALLESAPPMLAARTGGESAIVAVYRDAGARLIGVLGLQRMFREDVMARLGDGADPDELAAPSPTGEGATRPLLLFRLGEEEFALPIEVVDEVARAPEQITRLPRAPDFLDGVINLRGEVLPVIDQRRRFGMPPSPRPDLQRLVVVRTDRHRAGLIVDGVSEVLQAQASQIASPPQLGGQAAPLVTGVLNLTSAGRLVMALDPDQLLTSAEGALLEAFRAVLAAEAPAA